MSDKQQEISEFFAQDNWVIDETTPEHINDHFNKTWGVDAPVEPDLTPVFWNGMLVGSREDLKDGTIDPMDSSAWKP